jgi:hypothetical protein
MKQITLTFLFLSMTYINSGNAQSCHPAATSNAPDSRYAMQPDGTVTDKQTGLIWMRCALGQTWSENGCKGLPQTYSWRSAVATAESTTFAGQSDWRLPEQEELQSLVENRCYSPFINLTAFPNLTDNWFWSSSANPSNIGSAAIVNFFYDYSTFANKKNNHAVRLVRGEPL